MSDIQTINREDTRNINLIESLTHKQKYTDEEKRQASLFRDYLASSGTNVILSSFLDKALKNNVADELIEQQRKAEQNK